MEDKKMKWWPHGNEFSPMDELVSRAVNRIEDKMQNGVKMTGISTGYYDLDYILSGLQKSELIVIASRPIMGKSALAMNIALNVARNEEGYVLYFNMDKPENLMVDRMLSMDSMVDSSSIRLGTLSDSDLKKVKASADVIGKSKMVIDDTTPMTISELCEIDAGDLK